MRLYQAAAIIGAGVAPAHAATFEADYGIWLAGLPLGSAEMKAAIDKDRYKLTIDARLSGLAGLVIDGKGSGTAEGRRSKDRLISKTMAITAVNSREQRTVRVGFENGDAAGIEIVPPFEPKPDRIPLKEEHKRSVIDPVAALLMPFKADDPFAPGNCNRTIPVFDSYSRFDIVLSYAETKTVRKNGFDGRVLICNARYVPIAGHRPARKAVKYMMENRDITIWLAPWEAEKMLMTYRISVKTMIGTSTIEATRWTGGKEAPLKP